MRGVIRSAAALMSLSWTLASAQVQDTSGPLLVVQSVRLTDNGDHDGFADPHETVNVFLTLRNVSDTPRTGIVLALVTSDPDIDCVLTPVIAFGSLGARETREATLPLTFRVAGVSRSTPEEELSAAFDVRIWGDGFDAPSRPQQVTLDLDLDVGGGLLPTTFSEGFEGMGFGSFTTMTLDAGKASLLLSDGQRCQYNDPDFPNANSYGDTWCYLGFANAANNAFDWHVHDGGSPDGGRAYLGNNSLHWGMHPGTLGSDTSRLSQLDAIRTTNPVNLGWNGVASELSFKHQVALVNGDYLGGPDHGEAWDRGVVQVQLASGAGAAVGSWVKAYPYENLYDVPAYDGSAGCSFDPTDDGSTEDDYFDATHPSRRLGPSTTCYPEFNFAREGTTWSELGPRPGYATDGPVLPGARGPGFWVESKFSLDRWRGRRVRLRFLVTSFKLSDTVSWQNSQGWNPIDADDGWYIDDVRVTNTLLAAATVRVDTADRSALPGCPAGCSSLTGSLVGDPNPTGASGEPIVLDASASVADTCSGPFLYRFWHDRYDDGIDAWDRELRGWTDASIVAEGEAPRFTSRYVVDVQCSSRASCADRADVLVSVPCVFPFFNTLRHGLYSVASLTWDAPGRVDLLRGNLDALRASGGDFRGTVSACLIHTTAGYFYDNAVPPAGGFYYLAREVGPTYLCGRSWGTGSPAERPGAGGDRDADLALDPRVCP